MAKVCIEYACKTFSVGDIVDIGIVEEHNIGYYVGRIAYISMDQITIDMSENYKSKLRKFNVEDISQIRKMK